MNERYMQHGEDWAGEDLAGWLMSEKLDGCRAYWDGATLWTRGGNSVYIQQEWAAQLPAVHLDCELYDGVGGLQRCATALRYGRFAPNMKLHVFDAPQANGDWRARMRLAADATEALGFVECVQVAECSSTDYALDELHRVQSRGGEGLVLRAQDLMYRAGRTRKLLKVKYPTPRGFE